MAQEYNTSGPYPLKSAGRNEFFMGGRFDTNTTSAPDGVAPVRAGVTVAYSATGTYTVTISPAPAACIAADAAVWGAKAGISMRVISYSAGVITLTMYDEDNTSGIEATAADLDNITVCWWAVFTSES